MLAQCFDGLQLFGKTPEQLENVTALFMMVLADYSDEQISGAFRLWLKRESAMPTPADITQIIERGGRPAFSQSVYIRLEKKGYDARSREEDQYMNDYELYMVEG